MTWSEKHVRGAALAEMAHARLRAGEVEEARSLFGEAADCELEALRALSPEKQRTYGVTAVSALSLLYKAGATDAARRLRERLVDDPVVSNTFRSQIKAILKIIGDEASPNFVPPQPTLAPTSPPKSKAAGPHAELDARPSRRATVK